MVSKITTQDMLASRRDIVLGSVQGVVVFISNGDDDSGKLDAAEPSITPQLRQKPRTSCGRWVCRLAKG